MPAGVVGQPSIDEHRRRLIAVTLYVVFGLCGIVVAAAWLLPSAQVPWNRRLATITGLIVPVYVLAWWALQRGHTDWAARLFVAGVLLGSWLPVLVPGGIDGPRSYAFIGLNVLIAALALGPRAAMSVSVIDAAGLGFLLRWRDSYGAETAIEDFLLLSVIATISIAVAGTYDGMQRQIQSHRDDLARALSTTTAMLENNPDAIIAVAPDGTIRESNQAARDLALHHAHREMERGEPLAPLLPQQMWEGLNQLFDEARDGEPVRSEFMWADDGRTHWYQVFVRAVPDGGITMQVRDVSHERVAQVEQNASYRDRVELDSLREMEHFRRRLLNTASHELRTPITPIRLQMRLLEDRLTNEMDPKNAAGFQMMRRNIDRLARLVDDLLDVARLEDGEPRIQREPLRLDQVVLQEVEAFEALAEDGGVSIEADIEAEAPILGDAARLAQVMSNLITNALRHTDPGGHVRVRCVRRGDRTEVHVIDDGAGFEPEEGRRLYKPFSRLDETRRDGTGLGLYICKGIIELHGGSVWGQSDGAGQGADFGFSVPLTSHASLMPEATQVPHHE